MALFTAESYSTFAQESALEQRATIVHIGMHVIFYGWDPEKKAVRHLVYLHQLLDGKTLQDGFVTASMIECVLKAKGSI